MRLELLHKLDPIRSLLPKFNHAIDGASDEEFRELREGDEA
jgi:hypothetical protein